MKHPFIYLGVLLLAATACRPHSPSASASPGTDTTGAAATAQKNYFPVADYIRQEIRYVDSMPLAILKYTISGNRTDSSFIKSDEFHRLAQEFLLPELAEDDFGKKFSENSFMDATSGYLTFAYAPRDKNSPLQSVDVLAIPADTGTGPVQVKSIYLQTSESSGDTLIVKKMLWLARKSLLIVNSLQLPGKAPLTRQVKVVWDPTPSE